MYFHTKYLSFNALQVGTGFKDEDLTRLTAQMKLLVLPSMKRPVNYNVSDVLTPDAWFDTAKVRALVIS
jgi:ATP-dependent DNA ligase